MPQSPAAFPPEEILARLPADRVAAVVATGNMKETKESEMKKEVGNGNRENRTIIVKVRLTEGEFSRMKALMDMGGYPTVSSFLRETITKKRLPGRREKGPVDDALLREKMNALIYQVNRIGVNYNQFVATCQRQSGQIRPDGTPYLNTRILSDRVTALMRCTEGLRDEFAVLLDLVKRYINPEPLTQS